MNIEYNELFNEARKKGYAIGAFNVFNMISAEAVVKAAEELNRPVVMQMSMSVLKKIGIKKATRMLNNAIIDAKAPIIIHLDHCTEVDTAMACIDEGWKSIMYDGSELTLEENIEYTNQLKEYAKNKDVSIEGEVGVIIGVEDDLVSHISRLANFEETFNYLEKTSVDMIAPAIGTAHGLYTGKPEINYSLINQLANENISHVVIHGGTGLDERDYKKLVEMGASKINISTAIKHAYLDSISNLMNNESLVYNPLAFDEKIVLAIKEVVIKYMNYFDLNH